MENLFATKAFVGINSCSAAGWVITRQQRDSDKHGHHGTIDQGIIWIGGRDHFFHCGRKGGRQKKAESNSGNAELQSVANDHAEYASTCRTDGYPNANLARSPADGVGQHPVQPEDAEDLMAALHINL
ncbi:MAG TPA: hypothetical protein VER98_14635 [Terriglobia bacterium]|nr:hypothetical protein [Terriglobia bacterium]